MDTSDMPKRRLEEILPTPEKVPATGAGGSPRARVVSHLQKLLMGGMGLATLGCTGFGVVDPLPEPSRCVDAAPSLMVEATYVMNGTALTVELKFTLPMNGSSIELGSGAYVDGATNIRAERDPLSGNLQVTPTGNQEVRISIVAVCDNTSGNFVIRFMPKIGAVAGDKIPVTVEGM